MLPPPRATTRTSSVFQASLGALSSRIAVAISSEAPAPCTRTGLISTSTFGARRCRTFRMSWIAAPLAEVTMPIRRGNFGRTRFRACSKRPSASSFALQRFEFRLEQTDSARLQDLHVKLVLPTRFKDGDGPESLDLHPVGQGTGEGRHRVSKNHAGDGGALVFKSEILVAGRVLFIIGNFALHPDRAEARLEQAANRAGQLRDAQHPGDVWEKIGLRAHERCGVRVRGARAPRTLVSAPRRNEL